MHHPEDIALGFLAIREPAYSGNEHLGNRDRPVAGLRLLEILIHRRRTHRANIGNHSLAIHDAAARDQAPVNAGLALWPGLDQPIGLWAVPFREFPREKFAIELDGSLGIVRVNLEVNYSGYRGFGGWLV